MKWLIAILVVLLITTNTFWLYGLIDQSVTLSYRDQQVYQLEETRKQFMAVAPKLAKNLSKEEVISIVGEYTDQEPYEKEGCTWVGWLGLKFNENGRLQSVSPAWSYEESDLCAQ